MKEKIIGTHGSQILSEDYIYHSLNHIEETVDIKEIMAHFRKDSFINNIKLLNERGNLHVIQDVRNNSNFNQIAKKINFNTTNQTQRREEVVKKKEKGLISLTYDM